MSTFAASPRQAGRAILRPVAGLFHTEHGERWRGKRPASRRLLTGAPRRRAGTPLHPPSPAAWRAGRYHFLDRLDSTTVASRNATHPSRRHGAIMSAPLHLHVRNVASWALHARGLASLPARHASWSRSDGPCHVGRMNRNQTSANSLPHGVRWGSTRRPPADHDRSVPRHDDSMVVQRACCG